VVLHFQNDLGTQGRHGVSHLNYWVDEEAGKIFCLAEGPEAGAVNRVHEKAHGLLAAAIYPGDRARVTPAAERARAWLAVTTTVFTRHGRDLALDHRGDVLSPPCVSLPAGRSA